MKKHIKSCISGIIFTVTILLMSSCSDGDIGDIAISKLPMSQYPHFVAVSDSGGIYYSYDAKIWTAAAVSNSNALNGVTYGGGKFVAVGNYGKIFNSTDGINWTDVSPSFITGGLNSITYGSGQFVAVGDYLTPRTQICWSTDGTNWNDSSADYAISFNSVTNNGESFCAVGINAYYSTDGGVNWSSSLLATGNYNSVIFAQGYYKTFASNYTYTASDLAVSWSETGWVAPGGTLPETINSSIYSSGIYVIVGDTSGAASAASSTNGITWYPSTGVSGSALNSVIYGNELFVAVGGDGNAFISTDGITWSIHAVCAGPLTEVAFKP